VPEAAVSEFEVNETFSKRKQLCEQGRARIQTVTRHKESVLHPSPTVHPWSLMPCTAGTQHLRLR
jgi:hypothetical protein